MSAPTVTVTSTPASPRAAPRLAIALRKPLLATGSLRPISAPTTSTIRGDAATCSSQVPRSSHPTHNGAKTTAATPPPSRADPRGPARRVVRGRPARVEDAVTPASYDLLGVAIPPRLGVEMRHHTKDKGDIGLTSVMADLVRHDIQVALPISEHLPFDLVAVHPRGDMI